MFAHAQQICSEIINGTLIENCKLDTQFVSSALLPFEQLLGGYLPVLFWGVTILAVYMRYHNGVMAGMVGIVVLMVYGLAIPSAATTVIGVLIATVIGTSLYYIIYRAPRTGQ